MKKLFLLAILLAATLSVLGQGYVNFANVAGGTGGFVNAPVTNAAPGAPCCPYPRASGNAFRAMLYIGPAGTRTHAAMTTNGVEGAPAFFLTGVQAGYFNGGKRAISGYRAGDTITALVRVWSSVFASWEAAPASDRTSSTLLHVKLNGTAVGTSNLVGLLPMTVRLNEPPQQAVLSNAAVLPGNTVTLAPSNSTFVSCSPSMPFCGDPPFDFTWSFQGTTISTAPTLTITNARASDAGTYQLRIENSGGWIALSAMLTVTGTTLALSAPASTNGGFQFTLTGQTGSNYVIQSSTDLGTSNWVSRLTNTAPFTFVETNLSGGPQQFYRAVTP